MKQGPHLWATDGVQPKETLISQLWDLQRQRKQHHPFLSRQPALQLLY